MKIVIARDWHADLHEEVVLYALAQLGHDVMHLPWHQYFKPSGMRGRRIAPALKFQNEFLVGPQLDRLNRDLVSQATSEKAEVVFIYRGSHIYPRTLCRLRDRPVQGRSS